MTRLYRSLHFNGIIKSVLLPDLQDDLPAEHRNIRKPIVSYDKQWPSESLIDRVLDPVGFIGFDAREKYIKHGIIQYLEINTSRTFINIELKAPITTLIVVAIMMHRGFEDIVELKNAVCLNALTIRDRLHSVNAMLFIPWSKNFNLIYLDLANIRFYRDKYNSYNYLLDHCKYLRVLSISRLTIGPDKYSQERLHVGELLKEGLHVLDINMYNLDRDPRSWCLPKSLRWLSLVDYDPNILDDPFTAEALLDVLRTLPNLKVLQIRSNIFNNVDISRLKIGNIVFIHIYPNKTWQAHPKYSFNMPSITLRDGLDMTPLNNIM